MTPLDQSDDTWVNYSDEEYYNPPIFAGFDSPQGIWFEGRFLTLNLEKYAGNPDLTAISHDACNPNRMAGAG